MVLTMTGSTTVATTAFVIFCVCKLSEAFNCKFSNEGCESNSECCSGKCYFAHPGTNARCTKLSLHKPCLYTYQCEGLLRCGRQNTCCAKYWGMCIHSRDCCDPAHKCLAVGGDPGTNNNQCRPLADWTCGTSGRYDSTCGMLKAGSIEGFYYKRCLYSNNINQEGTSCRSDILVTLILNTVVLIINSMR